MQRNVRLDAKQQFFVFFVISAASNSAEFGTTTHAGAALTKAPDRRMICWHSRGLSAKHRNAVSEQARWVGDVTTNWV